MTSNASEELRSICLSMPEAVEQQTWGNPTYRIRGKIFAMERREGGRIAVWVKAPPGMQAVLIEAEPETFFVPPYVGSKGWVGMRIGRDPDWETVQHRIETSYELIAPKRRSTT